MNIHRLTISEALRLVDSRPEGLGAPERLARRGPTPRQPGAVGAGALLLHQFRSPLVILLLVTMTISLFLGDRMDVLTVLIVVLMITLLGFQQEYRAANAVAALLRVIQAKATAWRDGAEIELPVSGIVPGDVVILNAGDTIPGDGLLLESKDLFVDESALTGENYPAEKRTGAVAADARPGERANAVYEGTHVVSGTARALILGTVAETEFGRISGRLRLRTPETGFESGLRRFGELLIRVTLVFVLAIFAIKVRRG